MTDTHLRILESMARHNQRRLDEHDAAEAAPGSAARRHDLKTTAARSRAQVAAARARRRRRPAV
ncbi:MAG TPA: hypothetical protein VFH80_30210 [Solirubrobacteraceae bacterium]|nr:hypothetical protein [Solirubrobacteraceae bacterium]